MVSRGINKVILIGNLGQDPDVRYMSNGGIVTSVTLATTESWKDKQTGDIKERTEWHRVVLFGKLAEISSEYLHKGAQIYVEGSLQTRKWQDQNGQDRYTTEVIVGRFGGVMQMLGVRKREENVKSKVSSETEDNEVHSVLKDSVVENISSGSDKLDINFDQDIPF